jgi:hypothetical protein
MNTSIISSRKEGKERVNESNAYNYFPELRHISFGALPIIGGS